jgi:hypothetical protein
LKGLNSSFDKMNKLFRQSLFNYWKIWKNLLS